MGCLGRRPPYTVFAFVGVIATGLVVLLIHDGPDRTLLFGGSWLLLNALGLLAGVWLAWLVLTAVAAGDIVVALFRWPAWWTVVVNGAVLALLLARPTRRYARRGRPHPSKWLRRARRRNEKRVQS